MYVIGGTHYRVQAGNSDIMIQRGLRVDISVRFLKAGSGKDYLLVMVGTTTIHVKNVWAKNLQNRMIDP